MEFSREVLFAIYVSLLPSVAVFLILALTNRFSRYRDMKCSLEDMVKLTFIGLVPVINIMVIGALLWFLAQKYLSNIRINWNRVPFDNE